MGSSIFPMIYVNIDAICSLISVLKRVFCGIMASQHLVLVQNTKSSFFMQLTETKPNKNLYTCMAQNRKIV